MFAPIPRDELSPIAFPQPTFKRKIADEPLIFCGKNFAAIMSRGEDVEKLHMAFVEAFDILSENSPKQHFPVKKLGDGLRISYPLPGRQKIVLLHGKGFGIFVNAEDAALKKKVLIDLGFKNIQERLLPTKDTNSYIYLSETTGLVEQACRCRLRFSSRKKLSNKEFALIGEVLLRQSTGDSQLPLAILSASKYGALLTQRIAHTEHVLHFDVSQKKPISKKHIPKKILQRPMVYVLIDYGIHTKKGMKRKIVELKALLLKKGVSNPQIEVCVVAISRETMKDLKLTRQGRKSPHDILCEDLGASHLTILSNPFGGNKNQAHRYD